MASFAAPLKNHFKNAVVVVGQASRRLSALLANDLAHHKFMI